MLMSYVLKRIKDKEKKREERETKTFEEEEKKKKNKKKKKKKKKLFNKFKQKILELITAYSMLSQRFAEC